MVQLFPAAVVQECWEERAWSESVKSWICLIFCCFGWRPVSSQIAYMCKVYSVSEVVWCVKSKICVKCQVKLG